MSQPAPLERQKRRALAYSIALVDLILYGVTLWVAVHAESVAVALAASLVNGVLIAILFVVGHDACHRSFLPRRSENYVVGQICFLPSLHPFSLWDLGHNKIHHRYTNLATRDYVFRPLSRDQYEGLSPLRRALYRFHRSALGHLTYYAMEIWWPKMIAPRRSHVGAFRKEYWRDLAVVYLWLAALVAWIVWRSASPIGGLALGLFLPMAVFQALMSLVIYLHHTNPAIRWFDDETEWSFKDAQTQCTVYVRFPLGINTVFHNIMEHTAHHMRPGIPLYHLKEAQRDLAPDATELVWSLRGHLELFRTCRLYDFDAQRWTDYETIGARAATASRVDAT